MRDSIIDSSVLWDFRFIHETGRKIQYKTDQLIFSFRANRDSWRVHRLGKTRNAFLMMFTYPFSSKIFSNQIRKVQILQERDNARPRKLHATRKLIIGFLIKHFDFVSVIVDFGFYENMLLCKQC